MDFELDEEHTRLRDTVRGYLEREATTEVVARLDHEEIFPTELYAGLARLGLCGLAFGEEYGGAGADELSICIVAEEVARASATLAYAFIPTATFCAKGIARFGSEAQRHELLPEIAAGRLRFAMGLSEPDAGSDLTRLTTAAHRDGDSWVVTGQKVFTTGADTADYIFLLCRTQVGATGRAGLSVLLVPTGARGVVVQTLPKLAGQGTHTCQVFLDEVQVPVGNLVGSEGGGMDIVLALLDAERIYVGAQGCGIAQGALDMALRHATERVQFGKPIIEHQAVGHMLADMALDVEQARLLVWRAATRLDRGLPAALDASLAKVAGSEAGTRCANRGMQILGGYSYMVSNGMERYWRETKLNEIAGGSNQIQRNIIAGRLRRQLKA